MSTVIRNDGELTRNLNIWQDKHKLAISEHMRDQVR